MSNALAVDPARPHLTGKNADPEFRDARARKASAARHSARGYAAGIVRRWPDLTETQRAEVRAILAPVVGRTEAGR